MIGSRKDRRTTALAGPASATERVCWRGERSTVSALLAMCAVFLFVSTVFFITVAHGRVAPGAFLVSVVALTCAFVVMSWMAWRYFRRTMLITNLRAWSTGEQVLLPGVETVVLQWRWWYAPLQLADVILVTAEERIVFPAVENWEAALVAIDAIESARMVRLERSDVGVNGEIFLAVPLDIHRSEASLVPPPWHVELAPQAAELDLEKSDIRPFALLAVPASLALMLPAIILFSVFRNSSSDAVERTTGLERREQMMQLMEREVMPFARQALGPLVGGEENVTCQTCHGVDAEARDWRMPAVRALPEPEVLEAVSEGRLRGGALVQTAIYGYLATEQNQMKMGHMRSVVLPGMARILGRPAYDFTKSYEYNQRRSAFGCYHCHQLDSR